MKRLICLLFGAALVCCTAACGEPPKAPTDFSAVYRICRDDIDCRGTVTVEEGDIRVTVSSPGSAKGLSFDYTDDGLTVGYAGHGTKINADYIPSAAVPSQLYRALAYLPQASYLGTEDGEDRFSLPSPERAAELRTRDGTPTKLIYPDGSEVEFREAEQE